MANCGSCGGRENPKEAPVVGPAVILGNGAVIPFDTNAALDAWVVWNAGRGGDPATEVREGESLP